MPAFVLISRLGSFSTAYHDDSIDRAILAYMLHFLHNLATSALMSVASLLVSVAGGPVLAPATQETAPTQSITSTSTQASTSSQKDSSAVTKDVYSDLVNKAPLTQSPTINLPTPQEAVPVVNSGVLTGEALKKAQAESDARHAAEVAARKAEQAAKAEQEIADKRKALNTQIAQIDVEILKYSSGVYDSKLCTGCLAGGVAQIRAQKINELEIQKAELVVQLSAL